MLIEESRNAASYSNGPSVGRRTPTEIVIHHWGADGQTHDGVVNFFCTTAPTSAHFVVSAGRIHCLVNLTDVAWHAGDWDVNLRSIGIECRPEATNADYAAVAWLVQYLRGLYGNLPLTPHKKYAQTACPGRYDLARINKEASGAPSPTPATKPQSGTITPIQEDDFDMNAADKVIDYVRSMLWSGFTSEGKKYPGIGKITIENQHRINLLTGKVDAQAEVVKQLAKGQGVTIDYTKVETAAAAGVAKAMADGVDLDATVTIKADK